MQKTTRGGVALVLNSDDHRKIKDLRLTVLTQKFSKLVKDCCDIGLIESAIGLHKTELIYYRPPITKKSRQQSESASTNGYPISNLRRPIGSTNGRGEDDY